MNARLARDSPGARVVFTGGSTALTDIGQTVTANAARGRDILAGVGVAPGRTAA